ARAAGATGSSGGPQHLGNAGAARPLLDSAGARSPRQRRHRQLPPQPAPHRLALLEVLCRPARVSRGAVRFSDRAMRRALPDPVLSEGPARTRIMASIVMADDGIPFDGIMAETSPLGGAESAFVALAEALTARGHHVEARSNCTAPVCHREVR